MSAGGWHTCSVRTGGTVDCWGAGSSDGDCNPYEGNTDCGQSAPPPGTFSEVTTGLWHSCGIDSSDAVHCWGLDDDGQSTPP